LAAQLQRVNATFDNMKASLGTALLPVMEKFASVLITKILPQVEQFVNVNKDQLAASFAVAAEFAVKFLEVLVSIGNWIANNTGKVQAMAILIAGMFAVSGIAKFILAIEAVVAAMAILRTTALGAAIATALATGGVSVGTAVTALAAVGATALVTKNLFDMVNGKSPVAGKKGISPRGNANNIDFSSTINGNESLGAFLDALNKNTTAVKKNTKSVQDIATENAMKELAARQKALSGSSSIAIGGGGKMYGTRNAQGAIQVNVNAGAVVGSTDALIEVVKNGLETVNRRNGGGGGMGSNRYAAMVTL
jgi:hypothetical protein